MGTEINHSVFDELTSEALYWIGLLYTDGHIESKEHSVELVQHNSDILHLEKFKVFLGSNRKIKPDHGDCSRLRVNSTKIYNRLVELGFSSCKSWNIKPHELLKNSRDFWRGCVDGDGGIYLKTEKTRSDTITLCGTLETIFGFIIFLNDNLTISSKYPSPTSSENLYQVHYYGQEAKEVARLLYKDATVYLERKYAVYQQLTQID